MNYRPKLNVKDTVYLDRKFSSFSSSFFKPIVATSLLFLLPSLGMGADNVYTVEGTGPTISVTTTESSRDSNLSWSSACSSSGTASCSSTGSATWTENNGAWTGNNGAGTITNLVLRIDNNTIISSKKASYVLLFTNTAKTVYEADINAYGASASAISADFAGKSLGTSDSKINLDLRFASGLSDTKTITVKDLNTLNGNLTIGYNYVKTDTTVDIYKYDITVNTINGNLTLYGGNYTLNGTVNINTALNGSIYLSAASHSGPTKDKNSDNAALTVKFGESATMTGDIADISNGYAGIRKDVYFAGSGNVLTGNIVSLGTSTFSQYLNVYTGNRIYFTQGDMTGNIIAGGVAKTTGANDTGNWNKKGLNVVVFGDSGTATVQNLTGGILASDIYNANASDTNTQNSLNVVVLADNTTLNIKANSSDTAVSKFAGNQVVGGDDGSSSSTVGFSVTSGSIVARNFGVNEIRIYKGSTLNLNGGNGSIKSVVNDVTGITAVSNGSALNKINFLSEGGVINGSIVADNSGNVGTTKYASALIYVANNASGTITGNLETVASTKSPTANGRMVVTLGSSNTTSVTGVTTTNTTTNSTSTNTSTLTLQGSSNTITGLTASAPTTSGITNTANLVLDSSNSSTGQTTTISGAISNSASKLNFI